MFSEKPTRPNLLTLSNVPLPISRSGVQESVPTKKKGKRTLETFSEKPTHPPKPKIHLPFSFHFSISKIRSPRRCSYKKKKKRTLVTFSEKPPPTCPSPISLTL